MPQSASDSKAFFIGNALDDVDHACVEHCGYDAAADAFDCICCVVIRMFGVN